MLAPWKKRCDKPTQNIKKQRHYFVDKGLYSQSYGFSNSHLQIWELDRKEGWVPKNWCFQIVVMEKTLESSLDSKEIKPVNPKRNQSWIFIGRMNECWSWSSNTLATGCIEPIHWRRPWCWERLKSEGAGRGWDGYEHHQLNGQEFEKHLGDSGGQGNLACCSLWGRQKSDRTYCLNKKNIWIVSNNERLTKMT